MSDPLPVVTIPTQCCALNFVGKKLQLKRCGAQSLYRPIILVWPKGLKNDKQTPLRIEPGMGYCKEHRYRLQISDLKEMQQEVNKACKESNKTLPDWKQAEMLSVPIMRQQN